MSKHGRNENANAIIHLELASIGDKSLMKGILDNVKITF
jgi:ADP-dependent phosphofructokinase/glucokinase